MSSAHPAAPAPAIASLAPVKSQPAVIEVALIDRNELNPRRSWNGLEELGKNMVAVGQFYSVRVRPHRSEVGRYELVDGERRWRACKAVGKLSLNCEVGEWSDAHVLAIALSMGGNQEALTAMERAEGFAKALALPGATYDTVAAQAGCSKGMIQRMQAILRLPPKSREMLQAGVMSVKLGWLIARVPGDSVRAQVEEAVAPAKDGSGMLSVRAALDLIESKFCKSLNGAPFDPNDSALLPGEGACTGCQFRAGTNPEFYGDVSNPNTCMRTSCYHAKAEAARVARVKAEQSTAEAGKPEEVALTAEENLKVFPAGAKEIEAGSGYLAYTRPLPADLVKAEVAAEGAPKVCDVVEGVTVYRATDNAGREVRVVKVAEAVLGITEPAILKKDVAAQYGVRPAKAGAGTPAPGSVAGEQQKKKKVETAGERSAVKKRRAVAEWLGELFSALEAMTPATGEQALWSLAYEHHFAVLEEDEALAVVKALTEEDPARGKAKSELATYAARLRSTAELRALVLCMMWAPSVLAAAKGTEEPWVVEIHRALIAEEKAPAPAAEQTSEAERARLTSIAQARAGGMSAPKIARVFGLPLKEVCGMLELDLDKEEEAWWALDDELTGALGPLQWPSGQVQSFFDEVLGGGLERADFVPEEIRQLLEALSKQAAPVTPTPPVDERVEVEALRAQFPAAFAATGTEKAAAQDSLAKLACKCTLAEIGTVAQAKALLDMLGRVAEQRRQKLAGAKAATEGGS